MLGRFDELDVWVDGFDGPDMLIDGFDGPQSVGAWI